MKENSDEFFYGRSVAEFVKTLIASSAVVVAVAMSLQENSDEFFCGNCRRILMNSSTGTAENIYFTTVNFLR